MDRTSPAANPRNRPRMETTPNTTTAPEPTHPRHSRAGGASHASDATTNTTETEPTRHTVAQQETAPRLRLWLRSAPQQPAEVALEVVLPALVQVRDFPPVAQEVVAVELQQRVEVEQHLHPTDGQHHKRQIVRLGAGRGQ